MELRVEFLNAIEAFALKFSKNPFEYINESDVDGGLYVELKNFITTPHIIERQLEVNAGFESFDMGKIHREYPANLRFDLVALGDPVMWPDKDLSTKKYESFHDQPVKLAIETKLHAINEPNWLNVDNGYTDFKRFIEKLNKVKYSTAFQEGYVLNVFHTKREMDNFLESYTKSDEDNGWIEEFNELRSIFSRIKFMYIDLTKGKLLEVPFT